MVRIVALASGRGSNFAAILAAIQSKIIPNSEMVGLVVDRPSTGAQNHAQQSNVECTVVDYNNFQLKIDYHVAFAEAVESFQPDLIVAAGYMRILDSDFVHRYKNRILNIHPSLLPAFVGLNAQRQAIEYGVKVAGCTVHFVDQGLDSGPIVIQKAINVPENSTEESLSTLIRTLEHSAYIEAVSLFCSDRLQVEGRIVKISKQ